VLTATAANSSVRVQGEGALGTEIWPQGRKDREGEAGRVEWREGATGEAGAAGEGAQGDPSE
jgi:hypothetical protein